jgi:transposase InsO family protein
MDITYIPMARGFGYLCAVVDWFSRKILSWRLSITMDSSFCVDAVEEALATHGRPEIFNTDQGSQFTSEAFTEQLKNSFHGQGLPAERAGEQSLQSFHLAPTAHLGCLDDTRLQPSYLPFASFRGMATIRYKMGHLVSCG